MAKRYKNLRLDSSGNRVVEGNRNAFKGEWVKSDGLFSRAEMLCILFSTANITSSSKGGAPEKIPKGLHGIIVIAHIQHSGLGIGTNSPDYSSLL